MAKMLEGFKSWLNSRRHFISSLYTKDAKETQEPERSLIELPEQLRRKLVDDIENLSSNPADKKAIVSELNEAFELWQEHPNNANNSIVILSSPVIAVSKILSETLSQWTKEKQLSMKLLPLTARPNAIETIKLKLEHYLAPTSEDAPTEPEIVVIPNLSWCFLRSLEGLEGIDYLRSLLLDGSKNRFWIIGSGQVGWQYLNSVCALKAYCGDVFDLPALASEDLQEWLDPMIKEFEITFDEPTIDKQILEADKDNKSNYFDILADISKGVGTVAVQAFLKSISYEEDDDGNVIAQTPNLPELPDLESTDLYLLYSLLLHGDLTISTLAQSLGDGEAQVQPRVQTLRRQGIVEERDKVLKINPIYYPKLKRELAGNNFIINRE